MAVVDDSRIVSCLPPFIFRSSQQIITAPLIGTCSDCQEVNEERKKDDQSKLDLVDIWHLHYLSLSFAFCWWNLFDAVAWWRQMKGIKLWGIILYPCFSLIFSQALSVLLFRFFFYCEGCFHIRKPKWRSNLWRTSYARTRLISADGWPTSVRE